jgi:hypothetical protein
MSGIDILDQEPEEFFQGETVKWTKSLDDYPYSAGWTLKYYYSNASAAFNVTAVQSGTSEDYLVTIESSDTASKSAGDYAWQAWVTKGTEKDMVSSGTSTLKTSLTDGSATDTRSHAAKVLDAIEAVIESRASKDQEEVEIVGRKLKNTPLEDLLTLRSKYKAEVEAEETAEDVANGLGTGNRIGVRFSD